MRWTTLWCLASLLAACSGSDPVPYVDPFAPRTEPAPDSGCGDDCEEPVFRARNIFIEAQFGYDADSGRAVTADLAGYATVPPAYWIYLGTLDWKNDLNDLENYCYILLPFDHAGPYVDTDPRLYGGVRYAAALDPPTSNCHTPGWELERELWGDNVVRDFVDAYAANYFQAVGDPSPRIATEVIPQFPPELQPLVIGGSLGVPSFLGNKVDEVYGFAWAMDDQGTVDLDVTGYLEGLLATSVRDGDDMVTAYYDLRSYIYWSLE